ncbi:exodeoxyribonuclease VII large subunit [Patescibacteria group bacterium]|nr:exodeoxyribonuclease VII large subunit [Patescibacteria group bacterium]
MENENLLQKLIREQKHGKKIIANQENANHEIAERENENQKNKTGKEPFSVSRYLDLLNSQLRQQKARVQGEISSLDTRENVIYFSLKDNKDKSILNCLMWKSDYRVSGIAFEIGMEIIVEGSPDIYKPIGRLSFKARTAELVGEGALKKAYEQLKNKLAGEGLFAMERKKIIPEFPQKIGLITSETGAVIHDFLTNLGRHGFQIKFIDSKVEGQAAVRDLILAMDYFQNKDIDVLVIIRGGGSIESLQAFNNEALVRKISQANVPVLCGIGHEQDAPLASLVADLMVSTPSLTAVALNKSWEKASARLKIFEQHITNKYRETLFAKKHQLEILNLELRKKAESIFEKFKTITTRFAKKLELTIFTLKNVEKSINRFPSLLFTNLKKKIDATADFLNKAEKHLRNVNPMRQLKLGYSIASIEGKIIRSVKQTKLGDEIDILVSDGKIKSEVSNIEG